MEIRKSNTVSIDMTQEEIELAIKYYLANAKDVKVTDNCTMDFRVVNRSSDKNESVMVDRVSVFIKETTPVK